VYITSLTGWRTQYSSTLGPYEGGLHFSGALTSARVKALGLETVSTCILYNHVLTHAQADSD
jgi:glutamate dehydrogenase/leucine dehydrogenase